MEAVINYFCLGMLLPLFAYLTAYMDFWEPNWIDRNPSVWAFVVIFWPAVLLACLANILGMFMERMLEGKE